MKRWFTLSLAMLMVFVIVTGCGSSDDSKQEAAGEPAEVTVLLAKPEISKQFDETVQAFNDSQKDVKVSVVPLAGQKVFEKITSLYASNNAPTMMMVGQEFADFKDKFLDLTDASWNKNVAAGTTDYVTVDGKVYGVPVTVESFGLIYNKTVVEKAIGGTFDPATINTQDALKGLMEKIDALDGVDAIHLSPMDWSLGAHLSNIFFTAQSADRDQRQTFLADLKAGKVDLDTNPVYQGWLKTFDMMQQFNSDKKAPLAPVYDDGPVKLGKGKVGLWFMGNWAAPQITENDPTGEYGFLPVPISNNPADYGNTQISVGVPSYWTIDKEQSTAAEQAGAKAFIEWLVSSEKGQDLYVNKLNLIPVFSNFTSKPADSLSLSILNYMDNQKTLEWMNNYYPAEAWPAMGASMQKYVGGKLKAAGLTKELEDYWKTAK